MLEVGQDGISDLLGQRKAVPPPALAGDDETGVVPVNVTEVNVDNLLGPQTKPAKQEQDGSISQTQRRLP
jgi:hypothetical protein